MINQITKKEFEKLYPPNQTHDGICVNEKLFKILDAVGNTTLIREVTRTVHVNNYNSFLAKKSRIENIARSISLFVEWTVIEKQNTEIK